MKRKMLWLRIFTLTGIMMLSWSFASAQSKLIGKIESQEGEALAGANILLEPSNTRTSAAADGSFVFNNLTEKRYTVVVTFMGYQTERKRVEINQGTNTLTVTMVPSTIMTEDIIVSAIRAGEKTPVTYVNLSGEEIKKQNAGQDMPFLLALTPSLVTSSDAGTGIGYTNFRIRGTDGNRINITVNGIPLNEAESHGVFWVNMPDFASSVENIQVQRGVGTSTNGAGAFGGTVNMQTNNINPEATACYDGAVGSFGTRKNTLTAGTGLLNGKYTFDVRLSKITSDGFVDRAFSDLKSFYASAGYVTDRSLLKLNIFSGNEKTYQAWNGVPSSLLQSDRTYNPSGEYKDQNGKTAYYDNETDNYQQDHYQLHYSLKITPALNLNSSLHYTYGRGYYESYKQNKSLGDYLMPDIVLGGSTIEKTDLINQKWLDNDFYGAVTSLSYKKNGTDLTFGGAWNTYDGDHFGKVIWAKYYGNLPYNHEWYRSNGKKKDFNIYSKFSQELNDHLSLYADLQYRHIYYKIDGTDDDLRDISQKHLFDFFNPKAGLFYSVSENRNIYFSYGNAHREPNRSNYTDADPTKPMPRQEKLHDFELGYNVKSANYHFSVNLYNMIYRDQLILTGEINDVGSAIMTNAPKSFRRGIELSGGLQLTKSLAWNGNATFSRNKILDFVEYVDDWDNWGAQISRNIGTTNIAFSPEVIAGSYFDWRPSGHFNINLASNYVGKQYIDNSSDNDRSLDAYFVSNLKMNYSFNPKPFKKLTLFAHINNLFNEEYETNAWVYSYYSEGIREKMDGYFPQAGTHFMLGISAEF